MLLRYNFKKEKLIIFLLRSALFLIIVFLLDFFIGSVVKKLYYSQQSGSLYRTTFALDSTNADILIFGASRANHHYFPVYFEKTFHLSCYNTGRDGNAIFYHYASLQAVLKRYIPKIVILDVSHKEFKFQQESYDRLSSLLPYYDSHPEIRTLVNLRGPYERYKLLSKIYPYNSLLFQIAIGNTLYNRRRENQEDINGYIPLSNICTGKPIVDSANNLYDLDKVKIRYFESFIDDCKKNNIKLFVFFSPYYIKYKYEDPSLVIAKSIAQKNNLTYYDFSKDSVFFKSLQFFADESHLNDKGAKFYTSKVIEVMKKNKTVFSENYKQEKLLMPHYSMLK